ncbi:MAG: UDP-galactopyranose mutase [Spirochaetales bacterium]|nr:UDP-galactopyranose mutase [Spirochaetales bacterium]
MLKDFDIIIVGCGITGSVIAREYAEKGKKILILERRNHIGGNMYDYVDKSGVLVQQYGPHAFHTKKLELYEYMTRYAEWQDYKLTCGAVINGKYTPTPFNFQTIDVFFSADKAKSIKEAIVAEYPNQEFAPVLELLNHKNHLIHEYADFLFKNDYAPYTAKQWGISPNEIDPIVLRRVPVRFNYNTGYFDDEFQIMPKKSFTDFFRNLLNHKNIKVCLGENSKDWLKLNSESKEILINGKPFLGKVFYTGAIDELFDFKYGVLPYRSLRFEWKIANEKSFQNAPVVAYPQENGFTRITEYTKLPLQDDSDKTVYAVEYPLPYKAGTKNEPYYPVPTEESQTMYQKYKSESEKYQNLYVCGRLGDFKYYNMDNALERALEITKEL